MTHALQSVLVVHLDPLPGREADVDQWYTSVHVRDVMKLDGSIAVQRFRRHRRQLAHDGRLCVPHHEFLTVYEKADTRASIEGHKRHGISDRMPISNGFDFDTVSDFYFDPVPPPAAYDPARGFRLSDTLLCARIAVEEAAESDFVQWFCGEHAAQMRDQGTALTIDLFRLSDQQLMRKRPFNRYCAIYSVGNAGAAIEAWSCDIGDDRGEHGHDPAFAFGPHAGVEATIGCYAPVTPRITAESVLDAPSGERAVEDQVRAAQLAAGLMLATTPGGI